MKSLKIFILLVATIISATACTAQPTATVKEQLAQAKQDKQTVLMVVKDKDSSTEKILGIVNEVAQSSDAVTVVQMDVSDEKNADLIKEYRLSGAPVPLVLVLSNAGVMTGGIIEAQVTKEALFDAIPTPKYSEIVATLSAGKPVLTVVSNSKFKSDVAARELCEAAKKGMDGNAEVIYVDTEDAKESKLITMLNIKAKLEDTFIIAINGQGIMSGRFDTIPTKADLIGAATQVVQSGCAPGGCGPTCK